MAKPLEWNEHTSHLKWNINCVYNTKSKAMKLIVTK